MRNDRVDDVVRESLPGEVARGLRRYAATRDDAVGALRLAREPGDRGVDILAIHARERELVTDSLVPGAAVGEGNGPCRGVPPIVDEGSADERLEDIPPRVLRHAAALEVAIDLGRRAIAVAQRPERLLERRLGRCRGVSSRREPPLRPR